MNFCEWIKLQTERCDCVGDLARALLADPKSPFWSNRLVTYRAFLIYRDAAARLSDPLECAFAEWRREK
jgi:hypothetical protein